MSVMNKDGKILIPGGGGKWWSPYGDTDEEIRKNLKTGHMPNAPDAVRVGPVHFTGSKKGDDNLIDILGSMGALDGPAKAAYEAKHGIVSTPPTTSPSPQVEYDEEAEIRRLNETPEHKAFMLQLDRESARKGFIPIGRDPQEWLEWKVSEGLASSEDIKELNSLKKGTTLGDEHD